jgi:ABC-type branched-subunit amino acid transport system permease subunit
MNRAPSAASPWPALITIVAVAAFAVAFIHAERQWEVLALVAGAAAALLLAGRTSWSTRASAGWRVRPVLLGGVSFLAALGGVILFREDHFALLMISTVLLYSIACLGLTIQFGYAGVVNFAGAAFFGIGGYTVAVMAADSGLPHLVIIAAGGLISGLIGSMLALPLLRTRGHYAALITIAFGLLFKTFLEVNDVLGGPQGLKVPGMTLLGWRFNDNIELGEAELSFYIHYALFSLLLFTGALILVNRLERSWLGLSLDAVRLDETAAAAFGFDVARWKIVAFTLGNVFAGVAGAAYAQLTGFVAPQSFTISESLILVSIVILGGLGNAAAILPAAALVLVLPEKLQVIQEYRFLLFSLFVIIVLLFRPQGLFPRRLRAYVPGWGRP